MTGDRDHADNLGQYGEWIIYYYTALPSLEAGHADDACQGQVVSAA
jgi:hypothetical protein